MLRFKQFLMEEVKMVPGQGYVFQSDSTAPSTTSAAPKQQTPQPTPQPKPTPKPVIDVDPKKGLNIADFAEPMKDAQGNITSYRIRANLSTDEAGRPTVKGLHGPEGEVRIWKPGEGYQVFGTGDKVKEFAKLHGHEIRGGNLADMLDAKGEINIPVKNRGIQYSASGPSPTAANPSLASGSKISNAIGELKAIGGPLIAVKAGEMLAPHVQKAGEETGIIDALAKGISAVVPNSILAAGSSPAEEEREREQQSKDLKKMGIRSGSVTLPGMGTIGK